MISRIQSRIDSGEFTIGDLRCLMTETAKLGPPPVPLHLIRAMKLSAEDFDAAEDGMRRLEGIVDAMTPQERENPPAFFNLSRRQRIAKGAGVAPADVDSFIKLFESRAHSMKRMFRSFKRP